MLILARGLLKKNRVINTNDELGWMTFDLPPHASNTDDFVQPSSDLLGPRASRPQTSSKREKDSGTTVKKPVRLPRVVGGTPAGLNKSLDRFDPNLQSGSITPLTRSLGATFALVLS